MWRKRIESGAEPKWKRAPIEDPVNRSNDGPPVRRDRGQREQDIPGEPLGELPGAQASLRSVDAEQMAPGGRVASVEKLLQRGDVGS